MATVTTINAILDPVMAFIKEVINKEETRQILQTDLRGMQSFLLDVPFFYTFAEKEPPEFVKIWLQLLHNSLGEANDLLDRREGSCQSYLDSVMCNPRRLSIQIRDWKSLFNHLYQGFQTDFWKHVVLSGDDINRLVVAPVTELLKDVMKKEEDNPQIPQTEPSMKTLLQHMETLLRYITILFRDEPDISTLFQGPRKELLKIMRTWFQSLQSSLTEAKGLFDLDPTTHSQQIREWSASFDKISHGFQENLPQRIVLSGNAMVGPVTELFKDVINKEDNRHILQNSRQMESLLQYITTFFPDEPDIANLFQRRERNERLDKVKAYFQSLRSFLTDANGLFDLDPTTHSHVIRELKASFNDIYQDFQTDIFQHIVLSGDAINSRMVAPVMKRLKDVINMEDNRHNRQTETDLRQMEGLLQDITILFRDEPDIVILFQHPRKELVKIVNRWFQLLQSCLTEAEIREWSASCDKMYHGLQSDLSRLVTSLQFVSSKPFYAEEEEEEEDASVGSGIIADEAQPLSKDEAWMLFRRVAFKGVYVSLDIQERARNIAEECRGLPSAINVVAAAMIGQKSVHEWDNCLSSIQTLDPSFPPTHRSGRLDAQLYARLRYSYDALPNSHVKRCFLYCAMYKKGEEIDTDTLLQMWIGEGLVKSQQGSYLMDIAIARKYLKLLVDRFFFHRVRKSRDLFDGRRTIRVHECIHDMAVYIAQTEENCVFSQNQQNFPEVHDDNCSRISVAESSIEHLPTELRCPKLASLTLQGNRRLKELPSEFLLSVTSLRVLNLSGCSQITSIPKSIGHLGMLQFLSLSHLPLIKNLPEQICHISSLQFLDLSWCEGLTSLPSQIGQLTNLKHLNLHRCDSLEMIPSEMSELPSLSRLQLSYWARLSVEMDAPASIWSLKGVKSLTELQVCIDTRQQDPICIDRRQQDPRRSGRIIDGIRSEMRHLALNYHSSSEPDLLPDMQNMEKLESFKLSQYRGLSLPNCMFEHLEMVTLNSCHNVSKLSPLERLPKLKLLKLVDCYSLRELGIGSPNTYVSLQKLVLKDLYYLKSLGGTSRCGEVWNETTLPQLRVLKIVQCESLKRFPQGMEKLPNLCALIYQSRYPGDKSAEWWESLMWEDQNMKIKLQRIFIPRKR